MDGSRQSNVLSRRLSLTLQGVRPHIFGMTASPVNTSTKQTQMKVAEAVWQLERNMDSQVITVINRDPVIAAAPLPELKLVYYVRQQTSDALKDVEGELQQTCNFTVILENHVVAAAPSSPLKLVYYVRQQTSDAHSDAEGEMSHVVL